MATFFIFAALMIAAALAFVVVPLLRHARTAVPASDPARRLRLLKQAHASGQLDEKEYAAKLAALAKATADTNASPPRR